MTDTADDIEPDGEGQAGEEEGLDPVLAAILQALWDHSRAGSDKDLSLARLSKRASVQMSVLRRVLTQLDDAGLVGTAMEEDGRGTARLTEEGQALCDQLFDSPEDGDESPVLH